MHKPAIVSLLVGIIVLVTSTMSLSNLTVYAHNFSENENALFLTLIHQVQSETQLVQNNFPANAKWAQEHANLAVDLLNKNDPIVNNTTWMKEIKERNPRVATELTSALNSLKTATESKPASSTTIDNIKTTVTRIDGLLGEAVSSRMSKEVLNNSTTQALVLSNIANEIYSSYGKAFGISPVTISSMAGMGMSSNGSSINSIAHKGSIGSENSNMAGGSNTVIKNMTDYQTAQLLAAKAQEIFNKNLKPICSSSSNATNANAEVEKGLEQLKNAIYNKALPHLFQPYKQHIRIF